MENRQLSLWNFEVGDIVQRIAGATYLGVHEGDVCEVSDLRLSANNSIPYMELVGKGHVGFSPKNFKLIRTKTGGTVAIPSFKIGDELKCVRNTTHMLSTLKDQKLKVVGTNDMKGSMPYVQVKTPDKRTWSIYVADLVYWTPPKDLSSFNGYIKQKIAANVAAI